MGILDGIRAYGQAVSLMGHLRLWRYVLVPGLISVLLAALIFTTAWGLSDNIGRRLLALYPWEWGREALTAIATLLGGLFIGVFGLILFKHLVMALASPFMSRLSERIERELTGRRAPAGFSGAQLWRDLRRGLVLNLRNLFRELLFTLLLFLAGLVPLLTPFTTAAIFLIQSYYAGFGSLDYTLERHRDVRGSIAFVRRHRGLAIGIGSVYILLLLTVVGFLFALPLAAAAATVAGVERVEPRQGV